MKNIPYWAKANPVKARILIAICHFLVVINAILLGLLLCQFFWRMPQWSLNVLGTIFIAAYFLYPQRVLKKGLLKYSPKRRRIHDFILVVTYGLLISLAIPNFLSNNVSPRNNAQPRAEFMVNKSQSRKQMGAWKRFKSKVKTKYKSLKNKVKRGLRLLALKIAVMPMWKINLWTILLFISTLLLGIGVGALACNLSCTGYPAMAVFVFIFGIGLLVFGLTYFLRKIWEKRNKSEPKDNKS